MKKIIISLSIIGAVAAIIIGATTAFFSDTETSTGNVFTAGAIDLKIDNDSWYFGPNGLEHREDLSWQLDDLTGHLFFNYSDLKPGDWGEDTVSIHVYDNDAWACVDLFVTVNDDVSSTEPELEEIGELEEDPDNFMDGELAQELMFFFWVDDGDNVYENDERMLIQGPADEAIQGLSYALADASGNNVGGEEMKPLTASTTYYIGKVWCYGNLVMTPVDQRTTGPMDRHSGVSCDGSAVTNISQTDSMMADISFYAVQSRHNSNFLCSQHTSSETVMNNVNLENKDQNWEIISGDEVYGNMVYSSGAKTFYGTVVAQGLEPNKEYQLAINGPSGGDVSVGSTNDLIAGSACDAGNNYCGGWWTGALPVECQSGGGTNWEGFYVFDLPDCSGTTASAVTDASGNLYYAFNLLLRPGSYTGVKVLIKENFSPWEGVMYEVAPIDFTVN